MRQPTPLALALKDLRDADVPVAGEITLLVAGILAGAVETMKNPAADHTADIEWLNGLTGPLTIDRLAELMGGTRARPQAPHGAFLRFAHDWPDAFAVGAARPRGKARRRQGAR